MHRLLPIGSQPGWWSPRLSPWLVRLCGPIRRLAQRRQHRLRNIEVKGTEHLRTAMDRQHGVMITPNHFAYSDPFILAEAADRVGSPFYYMTAWQVFATSSRPKRAALRRFGCFSVDREGADMRSFRTAVEILKSGAHPLVIFPEGEMCHVSNQVMPFHDGAAAISLMAARKGNRPVSCIPAALNYHYVEDPTAELLELTDRLEQAFFWRPRPDQTLPDRIHRLAQGALALKELEFVGHTQSGSIPQRIGGLCELILCRLEQRYELKSGDVSIPKRVKRLRQRIIKKLKPELAEGAQSIEEYYTDLDDVFLVVQLMSYPGNQVTKHASVEQIAETLDKLEEDVIGVPLASPRGALRATILFGESVEISKDKHAGLSTAELTLTLEDRVQMLLNTIDTPTTSDWQGEESWC